MPLKVPTHGARPLRERRREYDQAARDRAAKAFYHTRAWLNLRRIKLADTPYCEDCHGRGELVPASHVHHVVEISDDWSLRLDLDNLRSLCASCHSRVHATA
jgi:5-methylcytosine-specific restriction endonuclease McrA